MIYALCGLSCFLSILAWRKQRSLKDDNKNNSFIYYFLNNALKLLVPFTCVVGFYAVISFWLHVVNYDTATIGWLRSYERLLAKILVVAESLKLSSWQSLGVLFLLFIIAALHSLFLSKTETIKSVQEIKPLKFFFSFFSRYSKVTSGAYLLLTIVCSFTFFGSTVRPNIEDLELRIKKIEADAQEIASKTADALETEVRAVALPKVINNAPGNIKTASNLAREVWNSEHQLRLAYQAAQKRFGITVRHVENVLQHSAIRADLLAKAVIAEGKPSLMAYRSSNHQAMIPDDVSPLRLRKLDETVENYIETRSGALDVSKQITAIIQLDERERFTSKFVDILVSQPADFLAAHFEDYPFAKAVIDVFSSTVSDVTNHAIEKRVVSRAVQSITSKAITDDESFKVFLVQEAERLVNQETDVPSQWSEYQRKHATNRKSEVGDLDARKKRCEAASLQLDRAIKTKEALLQSQKKVLLASLRHKFTTLQKNFPERNDLNFLISRSSSYIRTDVETYFETALKKYKDSDVSVDQIQALREMYTKMDTNYAEPISQLESIAALIGKNLGLKPVEKQVGGLGSDFSMKPFGAHEYSPGYRPHESPRPRPIPRR